MKSRILIAEDEARIASFVDKGLRGERLQHDHRLGRRRRAGPRPSQGEFDLVVLDLGLPKRDGFDVLQGMRRANVE